MERGGSGRAGGAVMLTPEGGGGRRKEVGGGMSSKVREENWREQGGTFGYQRALYCMGRGTRGKSGLLCRGKLDNRAGGKDT